MPSDTYPRAPGIQKGGCPWSTRRREFGGWPCCYWWLPCSILNQQIPRCEVNIYIYVHVYMYIYIYLVQHHPASKTMVDQGINGRSPTDVGGALHWMVLFPKPTGFCGKGHERTCTSQCGLTVARKFAKTFKNDATLVSCNLEVRMQKGSKMKLWLVGLVDLLVHLSRCFLHATAPSSCLSLVSACVTHHVKAIADASVTYCNMMWLALRLRKDMFHFINPKVWSLESLEVSGLHTLHFVVKVTGSQGFVGKVLERPGLTTDQRCKTGPSNGDGKAPQRSCSESLDELRNSWWVISASDQLDIRSTNWIPRIFWQRWHRGNLALNGFRCYRSEALKHVAAFVQGPFSTGTCSLHSGSGIIRKQTSISETTLWIGWCEQGRHHAPSIRSLVSMLLSGRFLLTFWRSQMATAVATKSSWIPEQLGLFWETLHLPSLSDLVSSQQLSGDLHKAAIFESFGHVGAEALHLCHRIPWKGEVLAPWEECCICREYLSPCQGKRRYDNLVGLEYFNIFHIILYDISYRYI